MLSRIFDLVRVRRKLTLGKGVNMELENGSIILGAGGSLNADSGTATATAGAATLNKMAGVVTSEALTTAAGAAYTLTLTDSAIAAADIVLSSVADGTNTTAGLQVGEIKPAAGSCTIEVWNRHATVALNGTIKISFLVVKA